MSWPLGSLKPIHKRALLLPSSITMAGTLQTQGLHPRIAAGGGIFRRYSGCSQATLLRPSGDFAFSIRIGQVLPISRSIRAAAGSDPVFNVVDNLIYLFNNFSNPQCP